MIGPVVVLCVGPLSLAVALPKRWAVVLGCLLGILSSSAPAEAQGWRIGACSHDPADAGPVRGRLIDDEGRPVVDRAISLRRLANGARCTAITDSTGAFRFRDLSAGTYRLSFGSLGLAGIAPLRVLLRRGDSLYLDIPVFRANAIQECLRVAPCAPVLSTLTEPEVGGEEANAAELLMLRVGIALAGEGWRGEDWVACVDAEPSVLAALEAVHRAVASADECASPERDAGQLRGRLRHVPTGRPARAIRSLRIVSRTEAELHFDVGYYVAPLWGAGYRCMAVRVGGRWVPRSCRMTMIS